MARESDGGVGGLGLLLLVVLALAIGGGAWNHQRNLALEEAELRPYRTLSDPDVATLLAATETEVAALDARYERARGQRASTEVRGALTEERLRDFERVQAHGRAVRALGQRASELGATLTELRAEQERREGQGGEFEIFLRRVLTLP